MLGFRALPRGFFFEKVSFRDDVGSRDECDVSLLTNCKRFFQKKITNTFLSSYGIVE